MRGSTSSILEGNVTTQNCSLPCQNVAREHWSDVSEEPYAIYCAKIVTVSIVSICIVLSNILNIHILSRNSQIPRISRLFLLNLSTSDLCVGLISCIPNIYSSVIGYWPYGSVWCQVAGMFHGTSCAISIWSISMVSIERYLAICKPMTYGHWRSSRKAYIVITCLWTLAVVTFISPPLSKPDFIYYQYSVDENMCGLHWEYSWFCVLTGIYIPVFSGSVLVFTNVKIMRKIINRNEDLDKISGTRSRQRRDLSAVKLLVITSSIYFLAWGPYVTEVFMISFTDNIKVPSLVKFILMWLANSNSFMNVITFSVVYKSFRDELNRIFQKCLCRSGLPTSAVSAGDSRREFSTSDCFQESQSTGLGRRNATCLDHVYIHSGNETITLAAREAFRIQR